MSAQLASPASPSLLPAQLAQHTVESLYAEHGPQRPWTYWLVLAGVVGAIASLPLIKVDVSVRAPGLVRPTTERTDLRPAVSGHIAEVLAHENDRVLSGQPLLVLRSRDLEERRSRNQALWHEHAALIADLNRIINAEDPESAEGSNRRAANFSALSATSAFQNQSPTLRQESTLKNFTADSAETTDGKPAVSSVRSVPSVAVFQTATLRQDHAQYLAQLESFRLAEAKAGNELARYTTLAAKGIATRQELDQARYEAERLQAESRLLVEQALARWQAKLREEQTVQSGLVSEAQRLAEEQTQYTLRAPADGVLVGFSGWSAGGFVAAGQSLGAVSPEDTLQVETYVSPRDIGLVRMGQPARLQIDAYPYTQWGTLDGTVTSISGDLMGSAASGTTNRNVAPGSFKVLVRPAATFLALPNGLRGDLKKGLTLSARFLVARRSVFQLLYEDVSAWLDPLGAAHTTL